MGKTIYKIEFEYDDNYGNSYQPLSKFTCYEIIYRSTDYIQIIDQNGYNIELVGSDSFIDNLIYCLNNPPFNEFKKGLFKMSKEEICSLPENIIVQQ